MAQTTLQATPAKKDTAKEITRTEPTDVASPFGLPLGRLFQDFWDRGLWGGRRWTEDGDLLLSPALDVTEDGDSFTVTTELPGLKKDDITVQFDGGVMAISGEKQTSQESRGKTFHRMERRYGSFYRAISLPTGADVGAATADYADGVLTIRVPKREDSKPKTLKVK
jgi:HSP20 family protein